jgi:phosphatidylinositol alpha 1,6-mannosyltransferase
VIVRRTSRRVSPAVVGRPHACLVRVAIVAESFLPQMNGVTHSLLRVLDHLDRRGDAVLVIAPDTPRGATATGYGNARIVRVPSAGLPGYQAVRIGWSGVGRLARTLAEFAPDVHLASPFVLGWKAAQAARQLDLPTVAVYQTEVPAYAGRYGVGALEPLLWNRVREIHEAATLTLAPSTHTCTRLAEHGVPRVRLWPRGVDSVRFSPRHRDDVWRRAVAPGGEVILGYVGRLAPEKQLDDLVAIADVPGTRIVLVGDGPDRDRLARALPHAVLTGQLDGDDLATAVASMDVLVHPGELETFCQAIQEAMASAVPVVAPARGGPLDLVDVSRTGWLYPPGDLGALRAHVLDLVGDERKRRAFGAAARSAVLGRGWDQVCEALIEHYQAAMDVRAAAA